MTAAVEMAEVPTSRTLALLPREHGAWAMLLAPFLAALILAGRLWETAPALIVVVGVFAIREPLVALARQQRIWKAIGAAAIAGRPLGVAQVESKDRRAKSERAMRLLAWYAAAIALGGAALAWRLPLAPLGALGAAAALLTALAVHLGARNRQRSVLLHLASAAGLTASSLLAWLAVQAPWDARIWLLWGLQTAHSAAALLAVHARLAARTAVRTGNPPASLARPAAAAVFFLAALGVAFAWGGRPGLAVAAGFSAAARAADLARLRSTLQTPLRRVGQRELALSCVFSLLLLAALR